MNTSAQIAKQFRDTWYGGNWTGVNMKSILDGINWEQATKKVATYNTVAVLVFHINYYISALIKVLEGEPLNASDKYSFDLPPILSQEDWENLLRKVWADTDRFIELLEQFPEERLHSAFENGKYGTYYRNLHGVIEHTHYHLGQLSLIKKLL